MRRCLVLFAVLFLSIMLGSASDEKADLPKRAIEKSQLTLPGSQPFHLKVEIVEATNLENDRYKATLEEYWLSPDKWRRTVKTMDFSQTLVMNGGKVQAEMTGDYYPNWLRTLVTAIFDPGTKLEGVDFSKSSDNPVLGGTEFCRRFTFRVGMPPVGNNVFSSFCFQGDKLASIGLPGFHAEYKDYKRFGNKEVARRIREYIEPGEELEAKITELTELTNPDESLFTISHPNEPLQTVKVSEETVRKLAADPLELQWPPVKGGKTEGALSVFISLDREGHVRESYGLNSDHPEMTDAARSQLASIRFKPAVFHGEHAQVEGILTFAYKTKIDDSYPDLTDSEARKLVIASVEPSFPPSVHKGSIMTMTILVGEDGKVHTSSPLTGPNAPKNVLFLGIRDWKFKLPERNGKPTPFTATLKFIVP
jgi:hypothetical protein